MLKICLRSLLAIVLSGFAAAPALADGFTPQQRAEIVEVVRSALKADPSILRDAIAALQEEDSAQEQAAASTAIASLGLQLTHVPGDPMEGNPQGEVTLVEFNDVRCPYCRRMLPAMAELLRRDHGLRVVYKDIPILGPGSVLGAKALLAAQKQDGYLRLKQALMTGPADVTTESVHTAAARLGLDWDRLQKDMADPSVQARIDANLALAAKLDIHGTPAFVIGSRLLSGAMGVDALQEAVAAARKQP